MVTRYKRCLKFLGNMENSIDKSYNFILFKKYMFVAMRSKECYQEGNNKVDINSLGFLGTFGITNKEEADLVRKLGPIKILEKVTSSKPDLEEDIPDKKGK